MLILMIISGATAGYFGLLLSKKLIAARNNGKAESKLIAGEYAYVLWCLIGALSFGLIQFTNTDFLQKMEFASVFFICLSISAVDFNVRKIPNSLLLALIASKTVFLVLDFSKEKLWQSLLGFGAACIIFTLPSLVKIHVGAGDIKFAVVVGLYLGMMGFLQAMIIMAAAISVYGIYVFIKRVGGIKTKTAMGPYLALGMFCSLLFPLI